jgi:hypothetical protein
VHGVGLEQAVDRVGAHDLGLDRQRADFLRKAAGRVFGRQEAAWMPPPIPERLGDGVPAIEDHRPVLVALAPLRARGGAGVARSGSILAHGASLQAARAGAYMRHAGGARG